MEWRERQVEKAGFAPEYVFTTLEGTQLSTRQVQITVKKYADKAGIDKNVTPHTLIHTFATHLYRETGKIRPVQKEFGHADLSITKTNTPP